MLMCKTCKKETANCQCDSATYEEEEKREEKKDEVGDPDDIMFPYGCFSSAVKWNPWQDYGGEGG